MGKVNVMGSQGHTPLLYDHEAPEKDEKRVSEVEIEFNKLMRANCLAFDVTVKDDPKQVKGFDPHVEEYTIVPPMAGGRS